MFGTSYFFHFGLKVGVKQRNKETICSITRLLSSSPKSGVLSLIGIRVVLKVLFGSV